MQKEINTCINVLKQGGTILYPTDTIWGIGCDATNIEAVEKIKKIKNRTAQKSLIILVDTRSRLKTIINTKYNINYPNLKPTTIIYPKVYKIAKNILAEDGSCGIRIPEDEFCKKLIKQFGYPITSTSANISREGTPRKFSEINQAILKDVDYIVNLRREEIMETPSKIIKIDDIGNIKVIRE